MKTELRNSLLGAMSRESNPNKTAESIAILLQATTGVPKAKVVQFINGDDDAITGKEAQSLLAMK